MARSHVTIRKATTGAPSVTALAAAVSAAIGLGSISTVASARRVPTGLAITASAGTASGPAGSNPIAAERRVDWTYAGATIVNRTTRSGSVIAAYTGSSATIQNALAAAADNTYVELGAGTFNLSSALNLGQKNNVTLRGQGMSTILNFTNDTGANWYWGGGSAPVTICGSFSTASDATPPTASVPASTFRSWTGCGGSAGSYPKGATVLNLATAPTGLAVGDILTMWQANDDANIPRAGFFVSDKTGSGSSAISWQGAYDDHGACLLQRSVVTAVSGNNVTINPPLAHGLFQTSLSPQVGWQAASVWRSGIGLENLRIVTTSLGTHNVVVGIARAKECWVKGVGLVPRFTSFHAGGAVDYGIMVQDAMRVEIRDGWISQMRGGGINTTTSYSIATKASPFVKVENMIIDNPESAIVTNIGTMGGYFGSNLEVYVGNDQQESGIQPHESGQVYNLYEFNSFNKFWCDLFHGNSMLNTCYRNHLYGWGFVLDSYHRYYNLVGNVIQATATRKSVVTDAVKYDRWDIVGYRFGYPNENASSATTSGVAADPLVSSTAFIWGDYTSGFGTQFNSSDVPSAEAFFPNPVPGSQTLPASQLYSAAPSFYSVGALGTVPFPPIGSDVTGGLYMGGRAHKLPARLVYDAAGGNIANFDPSVYGT